jgi:hypothetical protein
MLVNKIILINYIVQIFKLIWVKTLYFYVNKNKIYEVKNHVKFSEL